MLLVAEHELGLAQLGWTAADYSRGALKGTVPLHYLELLEVALGDGMVSLREKKMIERYRAKNHISDDDHLETLTKLRWSEHQYNRGSMW